MVANRDRAKIKIASSLELMTFSGYLCMMRAAVCSAVWQLADFKIQRFFEIFVTRNILP